MGFGKALTKPIFELGEQAVKRWFKSGLLAKETAPQIVETLTKNIDLSKSADIPDVEVMLKGMKVNNDKAFGAFTDYIRTSQVREHINRKEAALTGFTQNPNQYTRPDAIENLQKLGGQTKWGRTQRTIQGPVSPNLSDKTFAQGAKTQEEAIMAGTTKFVKDGDPFQIRNYAAGYAPKGQTTRVGTRKTTGRGITKEGDTRKINEMLATDPNITPEETAEFGRIMAEAAAKGMDGDHIIEVSRVANAVRNMSPERKAAYFEVMRRTNTPTGNHPKNIQRLTKEMNQVVKPAEIRALDNALRKMDKRGKSLLEDLLGI